MGTNSEKKGRKKGDSVSLKEEGEKGGGKRVGGLHSREKAMVGGCTVVGADQGEWERGNFFFFFFFFLIN